MNSNAPENLKSGLAAVALWLGILLGPLAVLSQLEANYALVLWACSASREWPLHLVSVTAILITLLGFMLSFRTARQLGGSWDEEGAGAVARARFMSAVGILISAVMLLVVIAQWIPVFIFGPCHR